jgi:rsbT co-antagonist protein RsbR
MTKKGESNSDGNSELLRLQAVFDNVVDGIVIINSKGIIEKTNSAVTNLFGYDASELIGENVKILTPNRIAVEHDSYIKSYVDTGFKKIIGRGRELEARAKDGTEFSIDLSVSEIAVEGDQWFVGIIRDISERKEADRLIEAQQKTLLELSTPAIQLWDDIVLMALVGNIDTERATGLIERLLKTISSCEARVAILDVTGVPVIDTNVARHLLKAVAAAKMLGAEAILTGINPSGAQTLVQLGIDLEKVNTKGSLRAGVEEAMRITGKELTTL